MLSVLSRIPVGAQKPVAKGLLVGAGAVLAYGVSLSVMRFADATETETSGHLWWRDEVTREIALSERLPYLLLAIVLFVVAVFFLAASFSLFTAQGRLMKYQAILVGVESLEVQQIADITHASKSKVYRDIRFMIDSGMISDFYIDHRADQVVSKKYVPARSHKTVVTCSGCGGPNELVVGITRGCSFCGQPLVLRRT